jgi:hypothetical protein
MGSSHGHHAPEAAAGGIACRRGPGGNRRNPTASALGTMPPHAPHHVRMIEIRKIDEAERPAMASRFRDLGRGHGHEAASARPERIAARLADPLAEQEFLLAAEGDRPLGVACFAVPPRTGAARPPLLLHEICVAADGQGEQQESGDIVRALLRALVRLAIARGCAGIDVGSAADVENGSGERETASAG